MAASPFSFFRGSSAVTAWELSRTKVSGIPAVIDGDAHLNNFGLFGTPQRDVVIDLNDFDETIVGPWEWDLKRLVASVNVAGRENGLNHKERRTVAMACVEGYRFNADRLKDMGVLDVWYLHAYPGRENPLVQANDQARAVFQKSAAKAIRETSIRLLQKAATRSELGIGCSAKTRRY
jgi:uncharacterized protein (DUF2252 family)